MGDPGAAQAAGPLSVTAAPVRLGGLRAGRLQPLAAFELASEAPGFGGFSGLAPVVGGAGGAIQAVSDRGMTLELQLLRDADDRITGVGAASMGRLVGLGGRDIRRFDADAEALTTDRQGLIWVGFERWHRITGRDTLSAAPVAGAVQAPLDALGPNSGVEALATTEDDALLAIAEDPPSGAPQDQHLGWRLVAGLAEPFTLTRSGGFSVTGGDIGPDGALYLLERRFSWLGGVAMRIRRFENVSARLARGESDLGAGESLGVVGLGSPIDNMEALLTETGPSGALRLLVLSDDNFNSFQKTLFIQYEVTSAR